MPTQNSIELVQKAYIAYYGRPADTAGLDYWANRLDSNNGDLSSIIDAFGTSQEYIDNLGNLSSSELIDNIYQQMFNRLPDEAGKQFYVNSLESGERSLSSITLDVLFGAQGNDLSIINNKLSAAVYFTNSLPQEDGLEIDWVSAGEMLSAISSDDKDIAGSFLVSDDIIANARPASKTVIDTGHTDDNSYSFNGHEYIVITEGLDFENAQKYAEGYTNEQSYLAAIESQTENDFLFSILQQMEITTTASDGGGSVYVWLGGSDDKEEGKWESEGGQALKFTNWGSANGLSEPDNYQEQDYMAMAVSDWPIGVAGQWNDLSGQNPLGFIVEIG